MSIPETEPPRQPANLARRASGALVAMIAGLLACLVLLEAALWGTGYFYAQYQRSSDPDKRVLEGEVRIMCIGESTTAYGGADAYPRQLEQVLYEMRPSMRFRVYNQGFMCGNTGVLLDILPTGLEQSRPHIVVSMMGANDTGQMIPLAGLSELTTANPLARLRVYRLYRFLEAAVERTRQKAMAGEHEHLGHRDDVADARWQEARRLARETQFEQAIDAYGEVCRAHPRDAQPFIEMGEAALMIDDGRNQFAEKALQDAIQVDPTQIAAWIDLGYLYEKNGRVDKADACFERALGCSFGVIARRRQYYNALVRYLARKGDDVQAERLFSFLEEATPDTDAVLDSAAWYYGQRHNPERQRAYRDRANALRARYACTATLRNYKRLQETLDASGVRLVCVAYPTRNADVYRALFPPSPDIAFVDNETGFLEAIDAGRYDDMFIDNCYGDFGHATREGNRLLAEHVAKAILDAWFTDSPQGSR